MYMWINRFNTRTITLSVKAKLVFLKLVTLILNMFLTSQKEQFNKDLFNVNKIIYKRVKSKIN